MNDTTRVFMPLRSNAAWFGDENCRGRLERQIKTYLVLYDLIVFENGRYNITAGVDGQGMQMMCPGDSFPGDRSKIRFFTPGNEFGIDFGGKQVLRSTCQSAYEIDYLPIVRDAGIEYATCIRWSDDDINAEIKTAIEKRVSNDLSGKFYHDALPDNNYLRRYILEGLYRDSLMAHFLNSPFSVDYHVAPVIALQQRKVREQWNAEIPVAFFNFWINLNLPDFTELSWDALCEFRESDAGVSFRHMIHRISKRVKDILPNLADQSDVDHWLAQEFNKELLAELSRRIKTPGRTLASVCMNVIPFGFIPSMIKDVKAFDDDQISWVSVVRGYKSNG